MDVSSLMTKDVISAKLDDSIVDIARIMKEKRIHAIPVLDEERKVLGIITESDFFTKETSNLTHLPTFIDFVQGGKIQEKEGEDEAEKAIIKATARDIMSSPCKVLPQSAGAEEFIKIVKETGFISVPIVNNILENKMVGILTVADVINIM